MKGGFGAELTVYVELVGVVEVDGWSEAIGVDRGGGTSSARTKAADAPPETTQMMC